MNAKFDNISRVHICRRGDEWGMMAMGPVRQRPLLWTEIEKGSLFFCIKGRIDYISLHKTKKVCDGRMNTLHRA